MLFSIITLFPQMFQDVFAHSIIKRAREKKLIDIKLIDLRNFGLGKHKTVDDRPYGGGTGMIIRVDVLDKAINFAKKGIENEKVVLLDPKGKTYDQKKAQDFSNLSHLILICGHYEGVDERAKKFVDEQISIGDYVLSGGEIAAMVILESTARLIPNVLKKNDATILESFSQIKGKRMLEYPQYTRPKTYKGTKVPKILFSGHQKKIEEHNALQALKLTKKARPDLLKA